MDGDEEIRIRRQPRALPQRHLGAVGRHALDPFAQRRQPRRHGAAQHEVVLILHPATGARGPGRAGVARIHHHIGGLRRQAGSARHTAAATRPARRRAVIAIRLISRSPLTEDTLEFALLREAGR